MKLIALLALIAPLAFAQLSNKELERRINILSEEITNLKAHQMGVSKNESVYGLGNSASKVYFVPQGLSMGAYGEIVYTNYAAENQDGDSVTKDPTVEAYRYVLYVGYKFNDKWVLNSEIEIEHVDEIYNEFMYVDYLHSDSVNGRFGLMLLPVGFLNEQHEPTLFPSVKRTFTETLVIPTTWREIGVGTFGSVGNIDYKAYFVNGGDADSITPGKGFRGARKKGGVNKNAATGAFTGRVDYNFDTQSYVGASVYAGSASTAAEEDLDQEHLQTNLLDLHGQYAQGGLRVRALYAEMNYANASDWNGVTGNTALPEKLQAGYLEAMYNVWAGKKTASLSPFVRYERVNLNAEFDEDEYTYDGATDFHSYTVGLAYAPIPRLVFKADYAFINDKADSGVNEFNLGMGFNF